MTPSAATLLPSVVVNVFGRATETVVDAAGVADLRCYYITSGWVVADGKGRLID